MKIKIILKPLLFLLVVATVLLFSDLDNRETNRNSKEKYRIAIFRFNSNQILETTEAGILESIKKTDLYKNNQIEITRYNPEGDMPTANMVAITIVNEQYDLVISISTPALQIMANANKEGIVTHVFCAVTDPFSAGVGITGPGGDEHPRHLVGIGTFQPVEGIFRIAKRMKPDLSKVGVVWCTSETCSEACVRKARKICKELNIELLEMGVESVTQVYETAISLTQKGVEALWIGGDNVVESAIDMYVEAGMKAHIPVMTNNPDHVDKKGMINLGANYLKVGELAGEMAIELLQGKPTNSIEIKNIAPELLTINESVLKEIKDNWHIPEDVRNMSARIIQ